MGTFHPENTVSYLNSFLTIVPLLVWNLKFMDSDHLYIESVFDLLISGFSTTIICFGIWILDHSELREPDKRFYNCIKTHQSFIDKGTRGSLGTTGLRRSQVGRPE